ncbi:MAG: response regulator, partial [Planctomycetes bacterium]|nr:response regulator [Planctomycetota bacterium]
MRLLLVEDFAPLAEATRRGLEEEGYAVEVAQDGAAALTRALTEEFDAILLDLMLPAVDGLQVLKTLRQRGVRTPVLILTAR